MKRLLPFVAVGVFSFVFCGHAFAVTITNYPSWDGVTHASFWGAPPNTPTYGQTFQAGTEQSADGLSAPILESVRFQIQNLTSDNGLITFNAYLYQWNGTSIVGPSLATPWNSSIISGSGYQDIGIAFGPVALVPGFDYIVFLTTIGNEAHNTAGQSSNWGGLSTGVIPQSDFFFNNGTSFSDLSNAWSTSSSISELAFSLNFVSAPVPEGASGATLLLLGLGGICAFGVRGRILRRR